MHDIVASAPCNVNVEIGYYYICSRMNGCIVGTVGDATRNNGDEQPVDNEDDAESRSRSRRGRGGKCRLSPL